MELYVEYVFYEALRVMSLVESMKRYYWAKTKAEDLKLI